MLSRKWGMVLTEGATENGFYALKFLPHHFGPIAAKIDLFNDLPDHCAGPVPA